MSNFSGTPLPYDTSVNFGCFFFSIWKLLVTSEMCQLINVSGYMMKCIFADQVYQNITKKEFEIKSAIKRLKTSNILIQIASCKFKTNTNLFLVQQGGAMAQESPKNSAAEIPVTSNGQLEDSHEHSFNRVRIVFGV